MTLAEEMKQAEKSEHAIKSDWFKFREGANQFRVLSKPTVIFEDFKKGMCFTDCGFQGSMKFMCYILDRSDSEIRIAKLPKTIADKIADWEVDDEMPITGYPMTYDVKVKAEDAGTKEVKYSVDRSIKQIEIDEDTTKKLAKKKDIVDIIEAMKDKSREKNGVARLSPKTTATHGTIEYPTEEIDPDSIPF